MKDKTQITILAASIFLISFIFCTDLALSNNYLFAIVTASTALAFCSIYISLKKYLTIRKEIKIQKIMDEIEKDDTGVGEGRILRFRKSHIVMFIALVAFAFAILLNGKKAIEHIVYGLAYVLSTIANTVNYFLDGHLYLIPAFLLTIFSVVYLCKTKR